MKFNAASQARFCAALSELCNVGKACQAAGVSRQTAYHHREKNPDFAKAWDRALEMGIGAMEDEAFRRAVDGVDEPIFYKGVIIATVKRYSDNLLMFLLRAHRPEVYRENHRVELSPLAKMSDAELDDEVSEILRAGRVAALMAAAAARKASDDGSKLH